MESLIGEIYGPRASHIRSMNIGGHSNKYKGFCEKFTFTKSMNKGRKTIIRVPMTA